ncbi:Ribonuclease P/MRP protein subunit RPP1 [Yarrowia sp. B02]|nr:Ribonuclease P/MRP protein subunit RPP1 [Yarrowia sp. B02]
MIDLNIPWPVSGPNAASPCDRAKISSAKASILFLQELGYKAVALNCIYQGKIPATLKCPIPEDIHKEFPDMRIYTRVTIVAEDLNHSFNLPNLYQQFDIVAVRPMSEKMLQAACTNLDIDIVSMDMTRRLPCIPKHKTIGAATERGVKIEVVYAPGLSSDPLARKTSIANNSLVVRAARCRGIVISSESLSCLSLRGPFDIMNLSYIWGLDSARAREAVTKNPEAVIRNGLLRKKSYKQVVIAEPEEVREPLRKKQKVEAGH